MEVTLGSVPCIRSNGCIIEMRHVPTECLKERRIDAPEHRQDLVPDTVTKESRIRIGLVLSERNLVLGSKTLDFSTGKSQ